MKALVAQLSSFVRSSGRRNVRILLRFVAALLGMVTLFSILFHFLMAVEGKDYSWLTGFYWTLTVMSTLGFGDITFHTDSGVASRSSCSCRGCSFCSSCSRSLLRLLLLRTLRGMFGGAGWDRVILDLDEPAYGGGL